MRTLELNEAETSFLLEIVGKTDAENAAIGVSGTEVAQYNIRVLRLQSVRRQLRHLEVEHEAHPVTAKIKAYRAQRGLTL